MIDSLFHPAVARWFASTFEAPSPPQVPAWSALKQGRHTLIAAPTGSGKTLAAFLSAIDDLVGKGEHGELADETYVVYVSPLKALSNDIEKNLRRPLEGITRELNHDGRLDHGIRVWVRTGDTPAGERAAAVKKPPHIVVTTPESLYILLTSEGGRRMLRTTRTVIVDEIHALVGNPRGTHLALTLERLERLAGAPLLRIGLSATQKPIEEVARYLVGRDSVDENNRPACTIIDTGHRRELDLGLELPSSPLEAVMSLEVWQEVYDRLAELIRGHRTTLVFVNTRRLAERATRLLSERLGEDAVTSHHGSLSKEHRLRAEERLKHGELKALVATASLELGIDVGDVDLVCQIGSTRSIATFLQRVGRSGHSKGGIPKGRLFPLTRDELVEGVALFDGVRRGELDAIETPEGGLAVLAQQIVAMAAVEDWTEDDLYAVCTRAHPYRGLPREDFDAVLRMLGEGFSTRRGRRSAYLYHDRVNRRVKGRRGARLAAVTSGGAIPDNADYQVLEEPAGLFVGTVNEDFAIESMSGDIFQLGNTSWRILRVEPGKVRVEDAKGQPPSIPFWLGEAPARTAELSFSVSRLRAAVDDHLESGADGIATAGWLAGSLGVSEAAAEQVVEYLAAARRALGVVPTQDTLVLERFFDESGGMQLVLHSPHGSRINRAWGLSLRKRFCRKFNFELQAAATEDALVLSLGVTHSFPLPEVFTYLSPGSVEHVLTQALLDAPMFTVRWRWNANRSLAVPRFRGGKKVPAPLQRMQAEDLLSVVFPDQLACAENLAGEREVPDHPLAKQTIRDCLTEAMDLYGFVRVLEAVSAGEKTLVARDLTEPSPIAQEILNAKPYAFLDDAPLEERRTQAVMSRRWLDPESAGDLGALDADAIARVRKEIRPDPRDIDELADALVMSGYLTAAEGRDIDAAWFAELGGQSRAALVRTDLRGPALWVAAERLPGVLTVFPEAVVEPELRLPENLRSEEITRETALVELVRSRLEILGPAEAGGLAAELGLETGAIDGALLTLESEGFAFRGRFTPATEAEEWCDRRLLARIHRYTLTRLRREIEPVSAADFLRFVMEWQGVAGERAEGPEATARAVELLEGFPAAATSWEADLLPSRVADYDPSWLDALCLSGRTVWARLVAPESLENGRSASPVRSTPVALVARSRLACWMAGKETAKRVLSANAATVFDVLRQRGASFFDELAASADLLPGYLEEALAELVAVGLVASDSFTGLRALLVPAARRSRHRRHGGRRFEIREAGRWSVLPRKPERDPEHVAMVYLRRYGVVFRKLLEREAGLVSWRELLRVYRRLEARGEIRGGRFVGGFTGEQFALPGAVETLRKTRRREKDGALVSVSGADPLNLVGIVTPGAKVPALASNRVLYRDGEPVAVKVGGEDRLLVPADGENAWVLQQSLVRRATPPGLRLYLGS